MKLRILSICLALCLLSAGCGAGNTTENSSSAVSEISETSSEEPSEDAEPSSEEPSEESSESQTIETDENLLTVEITLSAQLFEGQENFDVESYAKENDFISAEMNDDGSVTILLTKGRYHELVEETSASLDTSFAEFVNAADTPYIKEITHNDDFSVITMKVDRNEYENALDFTAFVIGVSVSLYQDLIDVEYHTEINVVDIDTGETINTIIYPDALESAE